MWSLEISKHDVYIKISFVWDTCFSAFDSIGEQPQSVVLQLFSGRLDSDLILLLKFGVSPLN